MSIRSRTSQRCTGIVKVLKSRYATAPSRPSSRADVKPSEFRKRNPKRDAPGRFVWFSDQVLVRPQLSYGKMIVKIARRLGVDVAPADALDVYWDEKMRSEQFVKQLYWPIREGVVPGDPVHHYEKAINEAFDSVVTAKAGFVADRNVHKAMRHSFFRWLMDPKSYMLPRPALRLLTELKDQSIPIGIIANSGPQLRPTLRAFERYLSGINAGISLTNVPVYNAWDHGYYKPHSQLFEMAALEHGLMEPSVTSYFVGNDPVIDAAPESVPYMTTVLLTSDLEKTVSDIAGLNTADIMKLSHFRVSDLDELTRFFVATQSLQELPPWRGQSARQRRPHGKKIEKPSGNKASVTARPPPEHAISKFVPEQPAHKRKQRRKSFTEPDDLDPL